MLRVLIFLLLGAFSGAVWSDASKQTPPCKSEQQTNFGKGTNVPVGSAVAPTPTPTENQWTWGSALGVAIASAILSVVFGSWFAPLLARNRLWKLSNGIRLYNFEPVDGTGHYRFRVHNTSSETIRDAIAYLTLQHEFGESGDIVKGPSEAYIGTEHPSSVREDRLCWALGSNSEKSGDHPYKIDIYPDQHQVLDFAQILKYEEQKIAIVSESNLDPPRVYLKPKNYKGQIKIVASNTLARTFAIQIVVKDERGAKLFGDVPEPTPEQFVCRWRFVFCGLPKYKPDMAPRQPKLSDPTV